MSTLKVNMRKPQLPSLDGATIEDIQSGLKNKLFTSQELVQAYLWRISEVNPIVHAVIELNLDALGRAKELDEMRLGGVCLGSLHGIPLLVKDNIGTADMDTTAGSTALSNARPDQDSTVISKLRSAGAIILGKANLSQWANYRSSLDSSSHGWSATGGQTYGVFYPGQSPGGSSAGSGVAIALGFATAALGTDVSLNDPQSTQLEYKVSQYKTTGSIGNPAQLSGLVGLKPTVGLTSRNRIVFFSEHLDSVGPMTRSVKDAAWILKAIAGRDSGDAYTAKIPFDSIPDYSAACSLSGLNGARIGVPRASIIESPEKMPMIKMFNASLDILRSLGAEIVEHCDFSEYYDDLWTPDSKIVYALDFKTGIKEYFSRLKTNPNNIQCLEDLIRYTKETPVEEYPARDIAFWEAAMEYPYEDNTSKFFAEAYERLYKWGSEGGITGALDKFDLDALVLPTDFANHPAGPAGLPLLSVPMGFAPADMKKRHGRGGLMEAGPNIPYNIAFLGRHFSEEKLIGYGFAFEQRTMARKCMKPYIMPNFEIR